MGALAVKAVALAARRFQTLNKLHQDAQILSHLRASTPGWQSPFAAAAWHLRRSTPAMNFALDALIARVPDLIQRVRSGRIRSSEMANSTIVVSSLGERGVEALFGVMYPPQVAVAGLWQSRGPSVDCRKQRQRARSVVTVTLAADHRCRDGHAGALFVAEIGKLLQEPDKL